MPEHPANPNKATIIAAVVAALIGAGATLLGTWWQIQAEKQRREAAEKQVLLYRAKYENAPKLFAEQLGKQIESAPTWQNAKGSDTRALNPDPEYRKSIEVSGRSIVSARDGLSSSLDAIGNRLDSDIDTLKRELAKPKPDPDKLVTTLEVLRQKWPAKTLEIQVAVRALLAQLGLVETTTSLGDEPPPSARKQAEKPVPTPKPNMILAEWDIEASDLDFQPVAVGGNSRWQHTLTNKASTPLPIVSAGINGSASADFSQTNNCVKTLQGGESCTFNIIFTPQRTGSREATLTINTMRSRNIAIANLHGIGN